VSLLRHYLVLISEVQPSAISNSRIAQWCLAKPAANAGLVFSVEMDPAEVVRGKDYSECVKVCRKGRACRTTIRCGVSGNSAYFFCFRTCSKYCST